MARASAIAMMRSITIAPASMFSKAAPNSAFRPSSFRTVVRPPAREHPLDIYKLSDDAATAMGEIIQAVADGDLLPSEGERLTGMVKGYLTASVGQRFLDGQSFPVTRQRRRWTMRPPGDNDGETSRDRRMHLENLMWAQALRAAVDLQPIDGPGGRLFPPTYPPAEGSRDKAPRHVVEALPSGEKRVLVDSVASQANRQEEALVAAREAKAIDFADVYVDLSETEAGIDRLSATEMPHRLSDAILRDSEFDGEPFAKSKLGGQLLATTPANLLPILEASPTTLLFGCWFSQHGQARPLKLQRCSTSEIWADNAVLGQAVGSRIDPLGIEKIQLYEAPDGDWTAVESEAKLDKSKPKPFAKKRPSEINHGNIAPSIHEQGITAERVVLRWAMPLAAIRRLRFGGSERDRAGQAYVTALGVLARVLGHEAGYSLRSRCDLLASGPLTIDVIDGDGVIETVGMTMKDAIDLFKQAEEGLQRTGIAVGRKVVAKPSHKLKGLIKANRQAQEQETDPAA
jgi:CRISPR-associated protein Csb1